MRLFLSLFLTLALIGCSSDQGNDGGSTSKKDCTLPWGGLLKHGEVVTAYLAQLVQAPGICQPEQRTCNDGVLSGSKQFKECMVQEVDVEPSTHEKPMRISDKDLKVGGIKEVGKISTWQGSKFDEMPSPRPQLENIPVCPSGVQNGSACGNNTAMCKIDRMVYSCNTETTWKVFGWVYEEIGRDYKPAEGVKADIFWFAGCFVGFCEPLVGPVTTDKWGYFELLTTGLMDSVRLNGLDVGLYAFCKDGKPIAGGGSYISSEMVGKSFSDAFANQKRIKPDSCKQ